VDIWDEVQLHSAFTKCQKVAGSNQVILEKQVHGVCHRFLVVNGVVIYVIRRDPISVIGDGKNSIADLVNEEVNNQRMKPHWERSRIKPIDLIARDTLHGLGYTEEFVPEAGARIPLRPIQSSEWGGSPQDVTVLTHPENAEIAVRSADLFNLHIAGVDIISPDISKPWHTNGAIINEVNFKPQVGVSANSRAYIPQVLTQLIEGDGRIPIESFSTEEAAKARHEEYCGQGYRCFLTTADVTVDFSGNQLVMPFNAIRPRLRALTCRSDVDAIVVVSA
jgi:cyanophycin synthetase